MLYSQAKTFEYEKAKSQACDWNTTLCSIKKHAVGFFFSNTRKLKHLFESSHLAGEPPSALLYESLARSLRSQPHLPLLSLRHLLSTFSIQDRRQLYRCPTAALHIHLRPRFSCRCPARWLDPLMFLSPPRYALSLSIATAATARVEAFGTPNSGSSIAFTSRKNTPTACFVNPPRIVTLTPASPP